MHQQHREWKQIEALFNRLCILSEAEQQAALQKAALQYDAEIITEARLLLQADRNMEPGFLEGNVSKLSLRVMSSG